MISGEKKLNSNRWAFDGWAVVGLFQWKKSKEGKKRGRNEKRKEKDGTFPGLELIGQKRNRVARKRKQKLNDKEYRRQRWFTKAQLSQKEDK